MNGRQKRRLLAGLARAEEEAKKHPSVSALDTVVLHPERLDSVLRRDFNNHLAHYNRCREMIEDVERHKDLYLHIPQPCN